MSFLNHRVFWRQIIVGGMLSWMALGLIACGEEEKKGFSGVLDDETRWEGDVVVSGDLTVTSKLTIEPCTTVRLARGASIRTTNFGEIHSVGTEDCPITFRPEKLETYHDEDGEVRFSYEYWGAVILGSRQNVKHSIEHTHFKQGGNLNSAILIVEADSTVRVDHVLVERSASNGVILDKGANVEAFSNVTFNHASGSSGSYYAMRVSTKMAGMLEGIRSDFPERERIFVVSEDELDSDVVWKKQGIPYEIQSLHLKAMLKLEAGVQVLVGQGGSFIIGDNGSLRSIGTDEDRVVIQGGQSNATSGFWNGITITPNARRDILFEHTEIRHAQTAISGLNYVGVGVNISARLEIRNVLIEQTSRQGISLDRNVYLDELSNVHFKDIEGDVAVLGYDNVGFVDGLSGEGLKSAYIVISGLTAIRNAVWKKQAFPYVLTEGIIRSHIEVDAGVNFLAKDLQFVRVYEEGSFSTHGTSSEPVVFEPLNKSYNTYYYGIRYYYEPTGEEASTDEQVSVLTQTVFKGLSNSSGIGPVEIHPTRRVTLDNVTFQGFACDVSLYGDAEPPTVINTTYRLCE